MSRRTSHLDTISRRKLLRGAGVMASSIAVIQLLQGCAPASTPTPAPQQPSAPTPTAAPAKTAEQKPAAEPTTVPAASPTAAAKPAVTGGHVTLGTFGDAKILNPILSTDSVSNDIINLIFSPLVRVTPPDGKVAGVLAESWKTSEDGLTYTFTLRKGVKFHDGKEVTAEDVKFTYDSILDEEINSPRHSDLLGAVAGTESIAVKDPYTIEFKLKGPYAPFLVSIPIYGILPKHILGDKKGNDFNSADFNTKNPVGSGPFKFKEWVKDNHITLEAFPDYFMGRPKIDEYIMKVVKDATVVAAQLKTGEVDYAVFEPAMLAELEQVPHLNIKKYDDYNFTFYAYQLDPSKTDLFQEKAVRQALLYGLDRQAIVDSVLFGQGVVANSIFPLPSWAYDPEGNPEYKYDPSKAQQLLDEAGWKPGPAGIREKNGKKFAFTVYTNAGNKVRESVIAIIQEQWKEIGIEVTPQPEEWNAFLNRITTTKDFEMFVVGFNWIIDPDESAMWSTEGQEGGFNLNSYSNEKADKLLADALKENDQDKRKALYAELDKLILDELPSPILFFAKRLYAVNKRVQNLEPNPYSILHNVHEWAVTDGK